MHILRLADMDYDRLLPTDFHRCQTCYAILHKQHFHNDKSRSTGLRKTCKHCNTDYGYIHKRVHRAKKRVITRKFISYIRFHNLKLLRKFIRQEITSLYGWVPQTDLIYHINIDFSQKSYVTVSISNPLNNALIQAYTFGHHPDLDPTIQDNLLEAPLALLKELMIRLEIDEVGMLEAKSKHYLYDIDMRTGEWKDGIPQAPAKTETRVSNKDIPEFD
jgi:hypothetical protein